MVADDVTGEVLLNTFYIFCAFKAETPYTVFYDILVRDARNNGNLTLVT